ncbi:M1 family metallopeptidase [Solilutibacter silvestris]|uniref:Aminopeptidase N n=1 Tax=Solilutibacter silvestris TaxID=1645665 RepID=A0A2K1Q0W6_9GAMM|nr:M1 family metallopeptidase [Lysobacter silvestris]PNS08673.1 Peptidase family M1 [Lysobacter silvestris]
MLAFALAVGTASVPFDVRHYQLLLQPELATRSVRGEERIDLDLLANGREIAFDAGALQVDEIRLRGRALQFRREDKRLIVDLGVEQPVQRRLSLQIRYHGMPKFGLEFHPEAGEIYTIFSTSQWMVAVDAPSQRATLDLSVVLPNSWRAVGTGDAVLIHHLDRDHDVRRWRLTTPMPSYVYGFVAGDLERAALPENGVALDLLADAAHAQRARTVFAATADVLSFFAEKAGVPYPHRRYSQAVVVDTIGQELAGLSLLSDAYVDDAANGKRTVGLIAHETAHQWWGNAVTCRDWNEFWLNEGMATFMTAAYLQHHDGEAAYVEAVNGWRERIDALRAKGADKPLVFPDWNKPSGDDRAVVYQKGAYFLHVLRGELGEKAFWQAIRDYTRAHMNASVQTRDLQQAMELASGRDLSALFNEWAYGARP